MRSSHLKLGCRGCDKERLADARAIHQLLEAFPEKLGLPKAMAPAVFRCDEGVSGVVLFAESHLSIHTFPEIEEVDINIFSRQGFDLNLARRELLGFFGATDHEASLVNGELAEPHVNALQIS